jgi:hypothetical protein
MRKSSEDLGPNNTKILNALETLTEVCKNAIQDVANQVASEPSENSLAPFVEVIRHITKGEGGWDLEEETNRSHSVAL